MEVTILDNSFQPIKVIDTFRSLIWTKRYYTCGDFELYIPADKSLLQYLRTDPTTDIFVTRADDDSAMIVESVEIETDAENGDFFVVKGRSLESILERHILLEPETIHESDVIQAIKGVVSWYTKSIPNFSIDDSLTYPYDFSAQFSYNTLLDFVSTICKRFGIGFKIKLTGANMILSFYLGSEVNVTFSPEFDNLVNSKYVYDRSNFANAMHVRGEGEGTARIGLSFYMDPLATGLALRMIYVDARDISSNNGEIIGNDYYLLLRERGMEKLAEHEVTETFEAEINPERPFAYKRDWNLGDIVSVTNEYGITAKPRIVEIIECWDENGYTAIPKFDALEVQ